MKLEVFAAQCTNCGKISYPTHFYCPSCNHQGFKAVEITGPGTLVTFTRVYNLAVDYVKRYVTLGIVELDMGIRALGQLDIDEPELGMRVQATIGVVREQGGNQIKGLKFTKA